MPQVPMVSGIAAGDALTRMHVAARETQQAKAEGTGFTSTLKQLVRDVDDLQQKADASVTDLLSGKSDSVQSVVMSVAKADLSFKLLVELRNKLVDAYKQTMSTQV